MIYSSNDFKTIVRYDPIAFRSIAKYARVVDIVTELESTLCVSKPCSLSGGVFSNNHSSDGVAGGGTSFHPRSYNKTIPQVVVPDNHRLAATSRFPRRTKDGGGGGGGGGGEESERKTSSSSSSSSSSSLARAAAAGSVSSDSWKAPKMKSTVVVTRTGDGGAAVPIVKECIQKICSAMNKLTSTNYAKQRDIILEEIDKCCCEEEGEDEEYQNGCKIAKRFLEIVAMNKTSAKLFADVFHEVVAHYHQASGRSRVGAGVGAGAAARKMGAAFEDTLAEFKRTLESSFEAIHYEDPNTNYDGYCVYVKKNEERKAAVIFIVYFCCYTSGGDGGGGGGDGGGGSNSAL